MTFRTLQSFIKKSVNSGNIGTIPDVIGEAYQRSNIDIGQYDKLCQYFKKLINKNNK